MNNQANESSKSSNLIFEAIQKIKLDITFIGKERTNNQQNYSFRGIDDLYNALHGPMSKHGVFSVPEVLSEHREERPTKSGGVLMYTILKVKYRFYANDGSYFDAITIGEASDSGDKSSNKAMSAAHKYALMQVFDIPTNEDNDTENSSPEFSKATKASPLKKDAPITSPQKTSKPEGSDRKPPATEKQIAKIRAMTQGVFETDLLAFTTKFLNKSSLKDLNMKEASELIGLIDAGEFAKWFESLQEVK